MRPVAVMVPHTNAGDVIAEPHPCAALLEVLLVLALLFAAAHTASIARVSSATVGDGPT